MQATASADLPHCPRPAIAPRTKHCWCLRALNPWPLQKVWQRYRSRHRMALLKYSRCRSSLWRRSSRTPLHYLAAFNGNQHTPVVFVAAGGYAAVALVTGCFASALPGWFGIKIATYTTCRCTHGEGCRWQNTSSLPCSFHGHPAHSGGHFCGQGGAENGKGKQKGKQKGKGGTSLN